MAWYGKGSLSRVKKIKEYKENYDEINFNHQGKHNTIRRKHGKIIYVYGHNK